MTLMAENLHRQKDCSLLRAKMGGKWNRGAFIYAGKNKGLFVCRILVSSDKQLITFFFTSFNFRNISRFTRFAQPIPEGPKSWCGPTSISVPQSLCPQKGKFLK